MPPKLISSPHSQTTNPPPRAEISTIAAIAISVVTLLGLALTLMACSSLFSRLFTLVMTQVTTGTENALKWASAQPDGLTAIDALALALILFPGIAALVMYALAVALIAYIVSRQFSLVRTLIQSASN